MTISTIKSRKTRLLAGACAAAMLAMAPSFGSAALGQAAEQVFNIPAQSLASALRQFGLMADKQVMFSAEAVQGHMAQPLSGSYEPLAALSQLLEGTGLVYEVTSSNVLLVRAVDTAGTTKMGDQAGEISNSFVLEEIIVTAEKRAESLQDIPIAISAFSNQTIERRGIDGLRDLQQIAPSLQFGESQNNPHVSLRGIGAELPNIGAESGIAIAQDGIVLSNRFLFDADFFDVERVEVMRGPQGTIAGRNATGGAINVYSRRPTEEFEAGIKAALGNYNRVALDGYLSGPILGDKLLARVAVRSDRAEGWLHNKLLDTHLNETDKVFVRTSFLTNIWDNFEAHLILEGSFDRGLKAPSVEAGRARSDTPSIGEYAGVQQSDLDALEIYTNTPANPDQREEKYQATLKLTWDVSDAATVTSTTGYIDFFAEIGGDYDSSAADAVPIPDIGVDVWQLSQEITLAADLSDRLDLIFGGLYYRSSAKEPLNVGLPYSGIPVGTLLLEPSQDLSSWSLYTQLRYRISDTLRVALGGRYTYDDKDFTEIDTFAGNPGLVPGAPASKTWSAFTPRVAIDYTPTDDMTVFASVSRGFKSGGFNTYSVPVDRYEPEYVWSYELGLKANWLDRRLRTALTAFYMDYTDLQQSIFGEGERALPKTSNAASSKIKGIEAELEAFVTDQFRVSASGTWLDATYSDLKTSDALFPELGEFNPATGLNVRDLSGNRLVRAPEWQFSFTGEYTIPLQGEWQAVLRTDYYWQDAVFFDFFNNDLLKQGAYGLLNLYGAIETEDGRWKFAAYARNLLDERYFGNKLTSIGGAPVPVHSGNIGTPRMYGVSLSHQF